MDAEVRYIYNKIKQQTHIQYLTVDFEQVVNQEKLTINQST